MNVPDNILVLGAGELGMEVLRSLAARAPSSGGRVSVLLRPATIEARDSVKRRDIDELRARGIGIVAGDLAAGSVADLARLFAGFSTVIGCTGFVGGPGTQRKLARAALDACVGRYFPWQFGVDYDAIGRGSAQDLFDEQLDVRDLLRAQDRTQWVIVSTGMFTSFLFEPSFGVVDLAGGNVHALGSWENAVTVTAPHDIGVLTAEIVMSEPRIVDRVVYTAGDTITYRRLADIADEVAGRAVKRIEWSVAELRDALARDPDDAIAKYRVVFAEGKGVAWDKSVTFNGQRGIPTEDVQSWAARLRR